MVPGSWQLSWRFGATLLAGHWWLVGREMKKGSRGREVEKRERQLTTTDKLRHLSFFEF